jgi:hypothetical protein
LPASADEALTLKNVVNLPDHQVLRAFDISWVNPHLHTYALAASALTPPVIPPLTGPASNPAIVIVDTLSKVVSELGSGTSSTPGPNFTPFAGNCPNFPITPPPPPPAPLTIGGLSGPNGVIVIEKGANADVWAGDGPIFNKKCDPTSGINPGVGNGGTARYSQLVVFDLNTKAIRKTISISGPGLKPGTRRADELCYNPLSDVVLVANPDEGNPLHGHGFITFIGEDSYEILQQIRFDGTDANSAPPGGKEILANGIEQCQFNPRDGKFYLNIPRTVIPGSPPNLNGPGYVLRISTFPPFHVEAAFLIPIATGCTGPAGLAVGPDHQLGVGCGGTNSLIISDIDGHTIQPLPGLTSDEDWYNPGSNHYYFARSNPGVLGVEDAGPPPALTPDPPATTASGSHSVAADPFQNQVYVPIRTSQVAVLAGQNPATVCGKGQDVFGHPGNDVFGCIAVYHADNDSDDISAESENDQGENEGGNGQGNGDGEGNGNSNGNGDN